MDWGKRRTLLRIGQGCVITFGLWSLLSGCGGLQYGEHVSKYGRPVSDPVTPPTTITLEPETATNPVNTEQTVKATVTDAKGKRVYSAVVEWILARANGAVGDIVEIQQDKPLKRALKMTNTFGYSGTNRNGQSSIRVTSVQEGTTYVIAVVPDIKNKTKHKTMAVLNWLDAEWQFPSTTSTPLGSPKTLETTLVRASNGEPLSGYQVKWNITAGPPALFQESGQTEAITETDENGVARVTLSQTTPQPGGNAVHVSIIKPQEPGRACCPAVSGVIAQEALSVEWVTPTLAIEQNCPSSLTLGEPSTFTFTVTNTSDIEATNVTITSHLGSGLEHISSTPPALVQGSLLNWTIETFPPNSTQEVTMELKPTAGGPLTHEVSVGTGDGFQRTSICSTTVGEPILSMTQQCPAQGMVGQSMPFSVTVQNTGTGEARNVRVIHPVPAGFRHASGKQEITSDLGNLPPGESRSTTFEFIAERSGSSTGMARVEGGTAGLSSETQCTLTVQEAKMTIEKTGPARRFLENQVEYEIVVRNTGDATATNVVVNDALPAGVKYDSSTPSGTLNSTTNTVSWNLGSVAAGESKTLKLIGLATQKGQQCGTATVQTGQGLQQSSKVCTSIEGIAAFSLVVIDTPDPVAFGSVTTYTVTVTNQGTAPATNVKVSLILPAELEYEASTGSDARLIILGKRIDFDPIPSLAPKAKLTFSVKARAVHEGEMDARVRVEMNADQLSGPVHEEESTHLYQ